MNKILLQKDLPESTFYDFNGRRYINLSKVFAIKDSFGFYIKSTNNTYTLISADKVVKATNFTAIPLLDYYTDNVSQDIKKCSTPIIGMSEKCLSERLKKELVKLFISIIQKGEETGADGEKLFKCSNMKNVYIDYEYLMSLQENNVAWLQQELARKQKDSARNCKKYRERKADQETQK